MREFFYDLFGIFGNVAKALALVALELPTLVMILIDAFKDMFKEEPVRKPRTKRK